MSDFTFFDLAEGCAICAFLIIAMMVTVAVGWALAEGAYAIIVEIIKSWADKWTKRRDE